MHISLFGTKCTVYGSVHICEVIMKKKKREKSNNWNMLTTCICVYVLHKYDLLSSPFFCFCLLSYMFLFHCRMKFLLHFDSIWTKTKKKKFNSESKCNLLKMYLMKILFALQICWLICTFRLLSLIDIFFFLFQIKLTFFLCCFSMKPCINLQLALFRFQFIAIIVEEFFLFGMCLIEVFYRQRFFLILCQKKFGRRFLFSELKKNAIINTFRQ